MLCIYRRLSELITHTVIMQIMSNYGLRYLESSYSKSESEQVCNKFVISHLKFKRIANSLVFRSSVLDLLSCYYNNYTNDIEYATNHDMVGPESICANADFLVRSFPNKSRSWIACWVGWSYLVKDEPCICAFDIHDIKSIIDFHQSCLFLFQVIL